MGRPKSDNTFTQNSVIYKTTTITGTDEQGNEVEIQQSDVYKKVPGKHFWKVYLYDFLHTLGLISNSKQMDVLFYILENTGATDNRFIGTLEKIAEDTNISFATVQRAMKGFMKAGAIKKEIQSVYMVNPNLLIKGDGYKSQILTIHYDKIEDSPKDEKEVSQESKVTQTNFMINEDDPTDVVQ